MDDEDKLRFLIVDDQQSIRRLCAAIGSNLGFDCCEAESAEAAAARLREAAPAIALIDLRMAQSAGMELLAEFKRRSPGSEFSIMTAGGAVDTAAEAVQLGAYDYIVKPFRVEELKIVLQRMAEKVRLVVENHRLRERLESLSPQRANNGLAGDPDLSPQRANNGLAGDPDLSPQRANKGLVGDPDLPVAKRSAGARPASATDLKELERVTIERVFEQVKGDKLLAGKMLGISRATLYRKIKRYGIGAGRQNSAAAGGN